MYGDVPICFVDTETTSLSSEWGEVWEFGGIRVEPDGREREVTFQIEVDLGTADPMSLKIGKFRERYTRETALPKESAAMRIERFTRGAHLVGNVISFDDNRLERLLRGWGECPGWHYHVIDMEALAVGFLRAHGHKINLPYKSSEISELLGVEQPTEDELHTALGDARWTRRMWDAVFTD